MGSTTPKAVLRHQKSPQSAGRNRAARPRGVALFPGGDHVSSQITGGQTVPIGSGFSTGSDPGLLSLSSNEEEEENGFINLRNNFGSR